MLSIGHKRAKCHPDKWIEAADLRADVENIIQPSVLVFFYWSYTHIISRCCILQGSERRYLGLQNIELFNVFDFIFDRNRPRGIEVGCLKSNVNFKNKFQKIQNFFTQTLFRNLQNTSVYFNESKLLQKFCVRNCLEIS